MAALFEPQSNTPTMRYTVILLFTSLTVVASQLHTPRARRHHQCAAGPLRSSSPHVEARGATPPTSVGLGQGQDSSDTGVSKQGASATVRHSDSRGSLTKSSANFTPGNNKAGIAGGDAYPYFKDHIGWWYDWYVIDQGHLHIITKF